MKGILLDADTADLIISEGSMQIGDNTAQCVGLILDTVPGEWREAPLVGANVRSLLGGNTDKMWAQQTKRMIRSCSIEINDIKVNDDNTVTID